MTEREKKKSLSRQSVVVVEGPERFCSSASESIISFSLFLSLFSLLFSTRFTPTVSGRVQDVSSFTPGGDQEAEKGAERGEKREEKHLDCSFLFFEKRCMRFESNSPASLFASLSLSRESSRCSSLATCVCVLFPLLSLSDAEAG